MRGAAILVDVGGTNARFALLREGRISGRWRARVADYPGLDGALTAFLSDRRVSRPPACLAVAAAGPVSGDTVALTNSPWRLSAGALRGAFRLREVVLVNDFAAAAWAVPHLTAAQTVAVGGGRAVRGAPVAILGPGTGLGVAGLIPGPAGGHVLVTEGGHVTMAPADGRESAILAQVRARFGHVSAERVLSGDGLVNLAQAIAALDGKVPEGRTAAEITARALAGNGPVSAAALAAFCAMLGTVAGNLALTMGARGGVYVAGGIVPRIVDFLAASEFRARFESKGRLTSYLSAIPTRIVVHEDLAFIGLRALLRRRGRAPRGAARNPALGGTR